jgi:hypothetical protein
MTLSIREANPSDIGDILEFDELARNNRNRERVLTCTIASGGCLVAERAGLAIGYAVLDYSFYGQGFIPLVYVR